MTEKRSDSEVAWKGRFLQVETRSVAMPDGKTVRVEALKHRGAAAVLPLFPDGKVAVVRQFRPVIETWVLEACAGMIEDGEEPSRCAERELEEELGLRYEKVHPLGWIWSSPGFTDEKMHLFAATGLTRTRQSLDEMEVLEAQELRLEELVGKAARGELNDGKTVACVFLTQQALAAVQLAP